jgi:hypothetical protein
MLDPKIATPAIREGVDPSRTWTIKRKTVPKKKKAAPERWAMELMGSRSLFSMGLNSFQLAGLGF